MSECCEGQGVATPVPAECPRCQTAGRSVGRMTVGAMAVPMVPAESLAQAAYWLCPAADCPVVYYAANATVIERDDVRAAVHWKDAGSDVPLCYCFGHTRRSIDAEVARTGSSGAFAAITAAVRAGRCACDVKSPAGVCCLGDIGRYEKDCRERAGVRRQTTIG